MKLLKKATLAVIMVCVMVLCTVMCAANISAAAVTASGECGDNVTWTLYDDGELVIDGTGPMVNPNLWSDYIDVIQSVTISNGVTKISFDAFSNCWNITEVTIPDSVIMIDSCTSLTSIHIPASVTKIGLGALARCPRLTNITVDKNNPIFYTDADGVLFNREAAKLIQYPLGKANTSYTVPDGITAIDFHAFEWSKLESVVISDSVTSIGSNAFDYSKNLKSVTVLSRNASFGKQVFDRTHESFTLYGYAGSTTEAYAAENGLNFVALITREVISSGQCGDNVTWHLYDDGELVIEGTGAMWDWTSNRDVPWYDHAESITAVTIGDSVTSIGDAAFDNCHSLTSISIPDSVISIGNSAFLACDSLTSISIPDSVTSIGEAAFYYCDSLTSVTIPNSVTSIGNSAFYSCDSLTSISIPDSVTSIGEAAFRDCTSLKSISILDSVTSIGDLAFLDCISLTSISLGDRVTSIGGRAFEGCTNLTSISIPDSVTFIGDYAFYECTGLTSVTVLSRDVNLGFGLFMWSNDFIAIYGYRDSTTKNYASENGHPFFAIDDDLVILESGNCSTTMTWTLYDNGELVIDGNGEIPNYSAETASPWRNSCKNIAKISLSAGITSIGDLAFYGCNRLTSISIPDSVSSIGKFAFSYCDSLTSISIPDSVTSIGKYAFSYCTNLTSISIPDSVSSIGEAAFCECYSLTSVTVLSRNVEFGVDVFKYRYPTLYGYAGSTTEAYAAANGYNFVALEEPAFTLGDITGDNSIDITDVIALFRYSMMPDLYPISYEGAIDFTKDGSVDITDVIALFRYSMMPDLYPLF